MTGNVLWVGPGQPFQTLAAAVAASQSGDTIAVAAGTYTDDSAIISHPLSIIGVGGYAQFVDTQPIANGKANLVVDANLTIENLEISGAQDAAGNGAGIRWETGNLTVLNSAFHDNQEGILAADNATSQGVIKNSSFVHNGTGGDQEHGVYIGQVASLTVDNDYFSNQNGGSDLKSRAAATTVTNSIFADPPNGTTNYAIDLPNGGTDQVQNNYIAQSAEPNNSNMIHFGGEVSNPTGSLLVTGNTLTSLYGQSVGVLNQTGLLATVTSNSLYDINTIEYGAPASVSNNTILSSAPGVPDWNGGPASVSFGTSPPPPPVSSGGVIDDSQASGPVTVDLTATPSVTEVIGSIYNDLLTGSPQGGDLLIGGGGSDTLVSQGSYDTLNITAGGDVFTFVNPAATGDVITHFQSDTDSIDMRSALAAMGWHGSDPLSDGTITLAAVAGGAAIMLSTDQNPADAHLLATVDGVSTLHPWDFYLPDPSGSNSTGGSSPSVPPPPPPAMAGVIDDSHASGPVTVDLTATPSVTEVIGSVYNDLLTGSPQGGDLLIGGGGSDTLVSQGSHDTLSITAGGDVFTFANPATTDDVITHFQSDTDSIDMRPALAAMGWHGSDPLSDGTISVASVSGGAAIMLSSDGNPADAHLLATVDGVSTLHSWDFYLPSPGGSTTTPTSPLAGPPPSASFDVIHGLGWVEGTAGNDSLIGDSGDDSLVGNGGNDSFTGGLFMQGFGGDDVFNVTNSVTHIVEPTASHAQVMSTVSYSLFAEDYNVSHLTLTGSSNLTGTGSWGNDVLIANSGNSTLDGLGGADTLVGGTGHDLFVFQSMSYQNSVIQNFVHGQDVVDLHGVLSQVGSSGDAIANGTVVLAQNGADTAVEINDHTGSPKLLVTLAGVHAASLTTSDFHY